MEDHHDKEYNAKLHFEHELINNRLTWLLTSQTILFAGLAFLLGEKINANIYQKMLNAISCLGILISIVIFFGIVMGITAKFALKLEYKKKHLGVRTWITVFALLPDIALPIIFAWAWFWIRAQLLVN